MEIVIYSVMRKEWLGEKGNLSSSVKMVKKYLLMNGPSNRNPNSNLNDYTLDILMDEDIV